MQKAGKKEAKIQDFMYKETRNIEPENVRLYQ